MVRERAQGVLVLGQREIEAAVLDLFQCGVGIGGSAREIRQLDHRRGLVAGNPSQGLDGCAGFVEATELREGPCGDDEAPGIGCGARLSGSCQCEVRGVLVLAAVVVEVCQDVGGIRCLRIRADRLPELRNGTLVVAEIPRCESGQVAGARVVRPVADALIEGLERTARVSARQSQSPLDQRRVGGLGQCRNDLLGLVVAPRSTRRSAFPKLICSPPPVSSITWSIASRALVGSF